MNEEKIYPFEETDMWDLIRDFKEYSTDYNKTNCEYYEEYLRKYQKEKLKLQNNWNELKKWVDSICFYDNDTITYEQISNKIQELENSNNDI